jgi:ketosteroid isomerase-like protein
MSEEAAVLFANDAFYNAFTTRDLGALEALWSREAPVVCIHPGWAPLAGYDAVMESWANILSGPGSPSIACQGAKTHFLSDDTCLVTCYERIGQGALVATNIFVKEAGGWRMVHHQASPAARLPAPERDTGRRLQ